MFQPIGTYSFSCFVAISILFLLVLLKISLFRHLNIVFKKLWLELYILCVTLQFYCTINFSFYWSPLRRLGIHCKGNISTHLTMIMLIWQFRVTLSVILIIQPLYFINVSNHIIPHPFIFRSICRRFYKQSTQMVVHCTANKNNPQPIINPFSQLCCLLVSAECF